MNSQSYFIVELFWKLYFYDYYHISISPRGQCIDTPTHWRIISIVILIIVQATGYRLTGFGLLSKPMQTYGQSDLWK